MKKLQDLSGLVSGAVACSPESPLFSQATYLHLALYNSGAFTQLTNSLYTVFDDVNLS